MLSAPRVLVVDLNNFARYPTLAVGLLVAILRKAGMTVDVFSPLACGVGGVAREPRPGRFGLLRDRLSYRTAVSINPLVRKTRAILAARSGSKLAQQTGPMAAAFAQCFSEFKPDAVLVSTYLMYQPLCREIAAACKSASVPCLIGGPYFYQPDVAREWIGIDGMTGLVGGEVEGQLPRITNHHAIAQVYHHYVPSERRDYRRAVGGLLGAVHQINRRPLSERAREFEGVM